MSHRSGRKLREPGERFLMRHYQYRSPRQVALRFETRRKKRAMQAFTSPHGEFWYERIDEFRKAAVPAQRCRRWEDAGSVPSIQASDVFRYRARRLLHQAQKLPRNLRGRLFPPTKRG